MVRATFYVLLAGIFLNCCITAALLEHKEPVQIATIKASSVKLQPDEQVCGYPGAYTVLASALQPRRMK